MTSHVDAQVQARIAAARAKTQQQREERAQFAESRSAGLVARKRAKLARLYCATCAKRQYKGTYLRCPLDCGAVVCKAWFGCGNAHLKQCDNRADPGRLL